jgi:hypothetical protein
MKDIVLTFKPDYNTNTIYGVQNDKVAGWCTDDQKDGIDTFRSKNPFGWKQEKKS